MKDEADICTVCAWRAECRKKFTISGRDFRCAEFVRDVSVKSPAGDEGDAPKDGVS